MKRPGYEVVYKLLNSHRCRRKDLADHAGTGGGSLDRWLAEAEDAGLIHRESFLRDDEKVVEYSLKVEIPRDLVFVVYRRGKDGPRTQRSDFADLGKPHYWDDDYQLGD